MAWYSTGTVAVTNNSSTVTGTGTAFDANSRVGDGFLGPDGAWYEVTNIASGTVMSIKPNYRGATASGQAYSIAPLQGYVKDSADALRALVNQYGDTLANIGAVAEEDVVPVEKGGTGAESVEGARANLELGPLATWASGDDLELPGTGLRFRAEFSNTTPGNRAAFQSLTENGQTIIGAVPSGTGAASGFNAANAANPENASYGQFLVTAAEVQVTSSRNGSGAYLPTVFYAYGAEQMSLINGGLCVGTARTANPVGTSQNGVYLGGNGGVAIMGPDNAHALIIGKRGTTGNFINFYKAPDSSSVGTIGSISTNGSSVTYNTTSDRHLKTDIEEAQDAEGIFDQIEWVRYRWKSNPSLGWFHGVVAQQLQPIYSEAVTGEDGAVDEDGNVIPMMVDYSKLVPVLGGKLSALSTRIAEQDARIAELEDQLQQVLSRLPA